MEHSITPASYTTRVKGLIGDQKIIKKGFKPSSTTTDQKETSDSDRLAQEALKNNLAKAQKQADQITKDLAEKAKTTDIVTAGRAAAEARDAAAAEE